MNDDRNGDVNVEDVFSLLDALDADQLDLFWRMLAKKPDLWKDTPLEETFKREVASEIAAAADEGALNGKIPNGRQVLSGDFAKSAGSWAANLAGRDDAYEVALKGVRRLAESAARTSRFSKKGVKRNKDSKFQCFVRQQYEKGVSSPCKISDAFLKTQDGKSLKANEETERGKSHKTPLSKRLQTSASKIVKKLRIADRQ